MSFFGGFGSGGKLTNDNGSTEYIFFHDTRNIHTDIEQTGVATQTGRFHYGGTELSYEIDTLNLLTASFNLFGNKQTQHGSQNSTTDTLGLLSQAYDLQNSNIGTFTGLDAAINYQLGFKGSKDKLLTFSYKYSYSPNKQFNSNIFTDKVSYSVPDY